MFTVVGVAYGHVVESVTVGISRASHALIMRETSHLGTAQAVYREALPRIETARPKADAFRFLTAERSALCDAFGFLETFQRDQAFVSVEVEELLPAEQGNLRGTVTFVGIDVVKPPVEEKKRGGWTGKGRGRR